MAHVMQCDSCGEYEADEYKAGEAVDVIRVELRIWPKNRNDTSIVWRGDLCTTCRMTGFSALVGLTVEDDDGNSGS